MLSFFLELFGIIKKYVFFFPQGHLAAYTGNEK